MSIFPIYDYAYVVDENGNYVFADPADDFPIVASATRVADVDPSFRRVGYGIASRPTARPASTFDVAESGDEWVLTINKTLFAGKYPTQAAAVGALFGYYTAFSGSDSGFDVWIVESLDEGASIDESS